MKFSTLWRTASFWCVGILVTIVIIPFYFIGYLLDPVKQRLSQRLVRLWGWTVIRLCFLNVKVFGREILKDVDSAVFVSNHQSTLDIMMLIGTIPQHAGFLAKKQALWVPIIGQAMLLAGNIIVDRSNAQRALRSVRKCIDAVKHGRSIIIFPEGTRTRDGAIGPFKSGSMKIPLRTGAPVVPVTICGFFNVMRRKSTAINPGQVVVQFGEPISTKDLNVKDFRKFVLDIENRLRDTKKRIEAKHPATKPIPR
jgi:1-acyl-sn-glycerol-3-phosphate acyltransferase